jgi:FKBP-type peptidyl-prolyl cis-trans isomerase
MVRIVKVGLFAVGAGVAVGLGVVGWMYLNPSQTPATRSSGDPVVLDTSTTPIPVPESGVKLPGPNDFHQYEAQNDKATALYIDTVVGQGKELVAGSQASVMYRGWLTNGTLFDETYTGGQSFVFKEGDHHVIAGWEEGLFGMRVGGKRRLIVPASRAYGSEVHGPIPANSMLIFDVELKIVD